MPWKDKTKTRAAAAAQKARIRLTAKVLGLCWRCLPYRFTVAATICDDCRYRLKLHRCGVKW